MLPQYVFGLSGCSNRQIYVGDELVVKLIVLNGVANEFEQLILQTITGRVFLRSVDGRKSPRARPDVFFDPVSSTGTQINDLRT